MIICCFKFRFNFTKTAAEGFDCLNTSGDLSCYKAVTPHSPQPLSFSDINHHRAEMKDSLLRIFHSSRLSPVSCVLPAGHDVAQSSVLRTGAQRVDMNVWNCSELLSGRQADRAAHWTLLSTAQRWAPYRQNHLFRTKPLRESEINTTHCSTVTNTRPNQFIEWMGDQRGDDAYVYPTERHRHRHTVPSNFFVRELSPA